ncbi:L-alanine exporter AlaE [Microbulbifer thermotolerans]|uniref:L-alanine exporter AlaE n=1 Tax=Microbulbifer thermotolerans TaxID=252514 RepID=A0A143HJ02_MICTH|nr:L-alanine exporter AlaE [Microbulbifer thermotolerans]AMX01460.1 hypothetical protein A3224_01680 [Microbulbifer thermotolerans]MCX2800348.1 L-alanine exporter AlaE [Microbulbifer thermotolerans]
MPSSVSTTRNIPESDDANEANRPSRRLDFFLDIFAMNSFSWLIAIPIELVLAGMSWQEHLKVRLMALVCNTLIARPFGLYRSWVAHRFGGRGRLNAYLVDTFVFLSFQLPLYSGSIYLSGAGLREILTASATFILIAGILGRPYGIYLDWLRRMWVKKRPFAEPHTLA